jgi:hypothetical protein
MSEHQLLSVVWHLPLIPLLFVNQNLSFPVVYADSLIILCQVRKKTRSHQHGEMVEDATQSSSGQLEQQQREALPQGYRQLEGGENALSEYSMPGEKEDQKPPARIEMVEDATQTSSNKLEQQPRKTALHDDRQQEGGEDAQPEDMPRRRWFHGSLQEWSRDEKLSLAGIIVAIVIAVVTTPVAIICSQEGRCPRTPSPTMLPTGAPTVSPAPTRALQWREIEMLEGDTTQGYHEFGYSVCLNHNGTIVAVGCSPSEVGQSSVEVYHQPDVSSRTWELLGQKITIPGKKRSDNVFLSDDGKRLVVFSRELGGSIHVFSFRNETWIEDYRWTPSNLPRHLLTPNITSINGLHVSPDGTYMVTFLSTNFSVSGDDKVQVHRISGGGEALSSRAGSQGAISNAGENFVVAMSVHESSFASIYRRVRRGRGLDDIWQKHAEYNGYGDDVAISGDGRTVAIANRSDFGYITVFRRDERDTWNQIGNPIRGETHTYANFTRGVETISDDGSIIGISDRVGIISGHVGPVIPQDMWFTSVKLNGDDWETMASVWDNNTADEYPCDISGDGTILCCGSPWDRSGYNVGLVTIYRYE